WQSRDPLLLFRASAFLRKRECEQRSTLRLIVAADRSTVNFDEALANRQSEPYAGFLAANKGLEQALPDPGSNPRAIVLHPYFQESFASGRGRSVGGGDFYRRHVNNTTPGQGIESIEQEIDHDLMDLFRIDPQVDRLARQLRGQRDFLSMSPPLDQ